MYLKKIIAKTTDELQTSHRLEQTSHRRVTDEYSSKYKKEVLNVLFLYCEENSDREDVEWFLDWMKNEASTKQKVNWGNKLMRKVNHLRLAVPDSKKRKDEIYHTVGTRILASYRLIDNLGDAFGLA